MSGDVRGEYGWAEDGTEEGGGVVRITKYTADRRGYRVQEVTRYLEIKTEEQEVPIEEEESNPFEGIRLSLKKR